MMSMGRYFGIPFFLLSLMRKNFYWAIPGVIVIEESNRLSKKYFRESLV